MSHSAYYIKSKSPKSYRVQTFECSSVAEGGSNKHLTVNTVQCTLCVNKQLAVVNKHLARRFKKNSD
jgi:hypothetical protein